MRFIVSSSAIFNRLQMIGRVINSKNTLPILDYFLFEIQDNTLTLTASDSETALGKGYGWQPKIDVTVLDRTDAAFLTALIEVRELLRTRMSRVSAQDRNHYEAMLYSVEQMLGSDNPK